MEALDSSDLAVGGRRIVVNEAQQPKAESSRLGRGTPSVAEVSERLYVGNLPYTATEESVRNLFVGHGFRPLEIYVAFDRELQRAKGYAFVSMASEEEALRAIGALKETVLEGRSVAVKPAAPRSVRTDGQGI